MIRVLSLGAGIQSSTLLLMSIRGELPRLDAWIFADTQYEPPAVYAHLEWLKDASTRVGIAWHVVTAGNLRADAVEIRQHRKSSDGKRYASIPFFVKNRDGTQGRIQRQCTKEYKIEPVERCLRREILDLKPRQNAPKDPVIEHWYGISSDESQRAKPPGRWVAGKKKTITDLMGDPVEIETGKRWMPQRWQEHVYPLLDLRLHADRRSTSLGWMPQMQRADCIKWLKDNYPNREVPRSACICCPFRSNAEWIMMRDTDPESWTDAVIFDEEIRRADAMGRWRAPLRGEPFIHRQLVPLGMADLGGDGEKVGGGCGTLWDDQSGGMCGV